MHRIIKRAVVVAGSAALLAVPIAGIASASTSAPGHGGPASCTSGTTDWFVYSRQPGELDTWFVKGTAGESHPSQCMQLRPEVTWTDSFGTHHNYGGWITTQLPTESATKTNGPGLGTARQERQWVGGSHRECRAIWPTVGQWNPCTG